MNVYKMNYGYIEQGAQDSLVAETNTSERTGWLNMNDTTAI